MTSEDTSVVVERVPALLLSHVVFRDVELTAEVHQTAWLWVAQRYTLFTRSNTYM